MDITIRLGSVVANGRFPAESIERVPELDPPVVRGDVDAFLLELVDVAIMALAEKVAPHAYPVTRADIDELRELDRTVEEILSAILTASSRSFISKTLDAAGVEPDQVYAELGPQLVYAPLVGRSFDGGLKFAARRPGRT